MKNKITQFIKKHEFDGLLPPLMILIVIGITGFLSVHHNHNLHTKANQNPSEYLVSIYIKNDKPTTSISVIDKEGRKFSYNNKKEGEIVDRIQSIVENNLPLLKQKQIPNSLPEAVPELRNKPLRVEARWKNSETQKESRIVSNGKVFIKKEFTTEVLVDKGEFSVTYPSINKRK